MELREELLKTAEEVEKNGISTSSKLFEKVANVRLALSLAFLKRLG